MPKEINRKTIKSQVSIVVALSLVLAAVVDFNPTPASSTNSIDTSSAVRYNPDGSPIGEVIYEFIDTDDNTKKVEAPFPINFFGERLPALCLSTNGVVYPVATVESSCSPTYDRSLEFLTLMSKASAIAPLALDLNFKKEMAWNPHIRSVSELSLTQISSSNNYVTFTTDAPHGFLVGDRIMKSLDREFLFNLTGSNFYEVTVDSVPSPTTYTALVDDLDGDNIIPNGTYEPEVGDRAVVYRLPIRVNVNGLQLSGTTLTITTGNRTYLGPGRKFTVTGTGNPALDGKRLVVASKIDDFNFTTSLTGVADLDPDTAGNQNEISFSGNRPYVLERDDAGAIQQVYFGSTTVNGQEAYAVTWYRTTGYDSQRNGADGARFPAINPPNLTFTIQLVIIKGSRGSDSNGWDFVYEYNVGYADDPSDGYHATIRDGQCSISDMTAGECRWAMGTSRYSTGPQITSVTFDGSIVTLRTTQPHGLAVGRGVTPMGLDSILEAEFIYPVKITEVVDAYTIKFPLTSSATPGTTDVTDLSPQATLAFAEAFELFSDYSSLQLVDAGGETALVRNSLNSRVLGRYTFGMTGGVVTGFVAPTMGNGISGVVPRPSRPQVMSVIEVNPTKIKVAKEIITITGTNLNTVTAVYIGGVRVPIISQSGSKLQVKAPKGLSGLVDLELKSSLNNVLLSQKLNFGGTAADGTRKATLVVGGFALNSRQLTPKMKARISRWLNRNSDLSTLTCTGFTSLPRTIADVKLSTKRGKSACNFSKRQRLELDTSVSQGIQDPRPGLKVRRVKLVLTP